MRPAEQSPLASAAEVAERFDRVWEATRPADPSPELLDALWARASAELDRIEAVGRLAADDQVIPIARRWSRRRIVAGIALAQAAVLLIGLGLALIPRPGTPVGPLVVVPTDRPVQAPANPETAIIPPAGKPMVVVGAEQTLFVRIDEDGPRYHFLDQPPMLPTMADNTPHDFFDALEVAANQ